MSKKHWLVYLKLNELKDFLPLIATPSSFASIKLANPGSPGKMAVKTEREVLLV